MTGGGSGSCCLVTISASGHDRFADEAHPISRDSAISRIADRKIVQPAPQRGSAGSGFVSLLRIGHRLVSGAGSAFALCLQCFIIRRPDLAERALMRLPRVGMGALRCGDSALAIRVEAAVFGELPEMTGAGSREERHDRRELARHWKMLHARSQKAAQVLGCGLPGRQLRK